MLMTHAGMCRGRAGVHMSEWCVHDVCEVHPTCVVPRRSGLVTVGAALEAVGGLRRVRLQLYDESDIPSSVTSSIDFYTRRRELDLPWGLAPWP